MDRMMYIKMKGLQLSFNTDNLHFKEWIQKSGFNPYIEFINNGRPVKINLIDSKNIEHKQWHTGFGEGIKSRFSGFIADGVEYDFSFETLVWIDNTYGELHFEIMPLDEKQGIVNKIAWPGPFEFSRQCSSNYTVVPMMQGAIIPNNWSKEIDIDKIDILEHFFYSRGSYMPWWGQIEEGSGYIAIAETPWDGGYSFNHPAGGPTSIAPEWYHSLGFLGYKRKIKYIFLKECSYNDLCKVYRSYIKTMGELITLEDKAVKNPNVNGLIGAPIIHSHIYYHIEPDSSYYDKDNIENNDDLVSFNKRAEQLIRLKKLGVDKAFFHLDGWGRKGYDNLHPDVLPPCEQAGGWDGMKLLSDTCKQIGYFFATHDQYRDYYFKADTFDEEQGVHDIKGEIEVSSVWYGGKQTILCAQLVPYYLKRNFEMLKQHGIELKGTYLDVFSVATLEQCFHNEHRMTRKECMEKRRECFEYVRSEGILASSEETVDWAVPNMELVHHAPYILSGSQEKGEHIGIAVPLFSLVYHDCLVVPWFLSEGWGIPESENSFLHGLLNGGTGYLSIDADKEEIEKVKVICGLHKQVGKEEMLKHELIGGSPRKQRTTFADGTIVEVDFDTNEYKINK